MARQRNFIETDVLTEAKKRINHIYDLHDNVVSSFSGGKDSAVLINLHWEVAKERGYDSIDVVFRDEELVPTAVLDTVQWYSHCLLYTSPSPRDRTRSRMPSSA